MAKPLTLNELVNMYVDQAFGFHIWVKELDTQLVYAAVTDMSDDEGIIAIWGRGEWFTEADYDIKWVAYLERPIEMSGEILVQLADDPVFAVSADMAT